jgi:hypothetical protein
MRQLWRAEELAGATVEGPFPFTFGYPVMRIPRRANHWNNQGNLLFDLQEDPGQTHPIWDPEIEDRLLAAATKEVERMDAPREYFVRFGVDPDQADQCLCRDLDSRDGIFHLHPAHPPG